MARNRKAFLHSTGICHSARGAQHGHRIPFVTANSISREPSCLEGSPDCLQPSRLPDRHHFQAHPVCALDTGSARHHNHWWPEVWPAERFLRGMLLSSTCACPILVRSARQNRNEESIIAHEAVTIGAPEIRFSWKGLRRKSSQNFLGSCSAPTQSALTNVPPFWLRRVPVFREETTGITGPTGSLEEADNIVTHSKMNIEAQSSAPAGLGAMAPCARGSSAGRDERAYF
jgi:hypothetical protein